MDFSCCTPSNNNNASSSWNNAENSGCFGLGGSRQAFQRDGNSNTAMVALESEIANLSIEEKEEAYNDLHSIPKPRKEDPKQVQQGLYQLDCFLETYKMSSKSSAYRVAEEQDKAYVQDPKFRLMFLRADLYDPKMAAQRIQLFFTQKLQLFGKEMLTKDILYQDLGEDDLLSLECGVNQYSPLRDKAGRLIYVGVASRIKYKTVDSYLRSQFYFLMSALEDESNQVNGISGILYNLDGPLNNREILGRSSVLRAAIPIRLLSGHGCFPGDFGLKSLVKVITSLDSSRRRLAYRYHFGTHTECMYSLMSFGVPIHGLPFQQLGTEVVYTGTNHALWINERKRIDGKRARRASENTIPTLPNDELDCLKDDWSVDLDDDNRNGALLDDVDLDGHSFFPISDDVESLISKDIRGGMSDMKPHRMTNNNPPLEVMDVDDSTGKPLPPPAVSSSAAATLESTTGESSTTTTTSILLEPTDSDVLSGRGVTLMHHPGNVKFRSLLVARRAEYENAGKFVKTRLAEEVLEIIEKSSGRFLQRSKDGSSWQVMDQIDARNKVASAFRSLRKEKLQKRLADLGSTPEVTKRVPPIVTENNRSKNDLDGDATNNALMLMEQPIETAAVTSSTSWHPETCESSAEPSYGVIVHELAPCDVVMGRGVGARKNPGNIKFRLLVQQNAEKYEKARKMEKVRVVQEVVDLVKGSSGRFLRHLGNGGNEGKECAEWEQVDDQAARLKVASAFRSCRAERWKPS